MSKTICLTFGTEPTQQRLQMKTLLRVLTVSWIALATLSPGWLAAAIAQLGAEVRLLAPALLDEVAPQRVSAELAGPIHARELRMGGRTIVLAANASQERVQAVFHLNETSPPRRVRVMFEQRQPEVGD